MLFRSHNLLVGQTALHEAPVAKHAVADLGLGIAGCELLAGLLEVADERLHVALPRHFGEELPVQPGQLSQRALRERGCQQCLVGVPAVGQLVCSSFPCQDIEVDGVARASHGETSQRSPEPHRRRRAVQVGAAQDVAMSVLQVAVLLRLAASSVPARRISSYARVCHVDQPAAKEQRDTTMAEARRAPNGAAAVPRCGQLSQMR